MQPVENTELGHRQRKLSQLSPRKPKRVHVRALSATSLFRRPEPTESSSVFEVPVIEHTAARKKRNWTDENSTYVKRIGQRAGGFKWMHAHAATYYYRWYNGWGITFLILSAISSAGNVPYVATCQTDLNWIKVAAIVLGFVVTAAFALQQFKDFGGMTREHLGSEANYDAFYEQIKQELQKNSKDRQDATDYVVWIAQAMTNLKNSSPLIPQHIYAEYRKLIAGRGIADPDGLDEIIIKEDSPLRKGGPASDGGIDKQAGDKESRQGDKESRQGDKELRQVVVETPARDLSPMELIQMERWNEQAGV